MNKRDLLRLYNKIKKILFVVLVILVLTVGTIPKLMEIEGLFETFLIAGILVFLEMFLGLYATMIPDQDQPQLYEGIAELLPHLFSKSRTSG